MLATTARLRCCPGVTPAPRPLPELRSLAISYHLLSWSILWGVQCSILVDRRRLVSVTTKPWRWHRRELPMGEVRRCRGGSRLHSRNACCLQGDHQPVSCPPVCNSPRTRRRGRIGCRSACWTVRGPTWIPVSESYRLCMVECPSLCRSPEPRSCRCSRTRTKGQDKLNGVVAANLANALSPMISGSISLKPSLGSADPS